MSFATPADIQRKSETAYGRFLTAWLAGESETFFPYRVRANLKLDKQNPKSAIAANDKLLARSKSQRSWGYSVQREEVKSQVFGRNWFAKSITIDTQADLLRLAGKTQEFAATLAVVAAVRESFPALDSWLTRYIKSAHKLHPELSGLISVSQFFINHPWPNCFARQIPVGVDTKFIERNNSTLRQWLDILLPDHGIDVNETKFARRFGLRDGRAHRGVRFLDEAIQIECDVSHRELSLPVESIAKLNIKNATVFVTENRLTLFTLPDCDRGIAIEGAGNAVNQLEPISWLSQNRLLYWGDIDADGFLILARLRNLFPNTQSILMDLETLKAHEQWTVQGNGSTPAAPSNLTHAERQVFDHCVAHNLRLEQELVLQTWSTCALKNILP